MTSGRSWSALGSLLLCGWPTFEPWDMRPRFLSFPRSRWWIRSKNLPFLIVSDSFGVSERRELVIYYGFIGAIGVRQYWFVLLVV